MTHTLAVVCLSDEVNHHNDYCVFLYILSCSVQHEIWSSLKSNRSLKVTHLVHLTQLPLIVVYCCCCFVVVVVCRATEDDQGE